ncbi:putative pilus assembly domain protein, partial [Vibrio parahaemolyticus V-223/04]
ITSVKTNH